MTISFIIFVKKYYLFQKCSTSTSISFIVSYLPIPPSSLGTSGPEHRPSQENNVHHKIKDEQQDTEQIQCVYQWMHTGEKKENFTSTVSVLDQHSFNILIITCSRSQSILRPALSWQSINVLIDTQLTAGRYSLKCWQTHLLQVLIDTHVMSAKISQLSSVDQVSTVCQPFVGINWGINYWLSFYHRSLNCTWSNVSLNL